MILSADGRPGSIAFTLTEDAFASHDVVYVSAYHNQVADGFTDVGDVTFVSRLYNTYLSTDKAADWAELEPVARDRDRARGRQRRPVRDVCHHPAGRLQHLPVGHVSGRR